MQLSITKTKRQKIAEREVPASHHIGLSHLVSPSVFQTKDGAIGSVIALQGCPFEVQDQATLNWNQQQIAKFILLLTDKLAVYMITHRRLQNKYPDGEFTNPFAKSFNEAYKNKFSHQTLFVNEQYLVLITKNKGRKHKKNFFNHLLHSTVKQEWEVFLNKQKKQLKNSVLYALEYLKDFSPRLLSERESIHGKKSEVLEFFSILINGKKMPFAYPRQELSTVLPHYRLFFGNNTLEWQGNTAQDRKLAAMLSLWKYSSESSNNALDHLLRTAFEYVAVHSFAPLVQKDSQHLIFKQSKHLIDANDASISQQEELIDATDLLASGQMTFGMHHNTVMILADNQEELEESCAEVSKIYSDTGIKVIRESLNIESAFWSQIPGNFAYIRRDSMISSENFADYCSLHNYHHGYLDENHLGSALMLVESSSRTALYVNLHERSSGKQHDLSRAHTTIIGTTGSGKTTLQNTLSLMFHKYNATSFIFDRDRSAEIYVHAMGGFYSRITPDKCTGFNPLQLPDTAVNKHFLKRWLGSLLVKKGEHLSALEEKQVEEVIERNYTLYAEKRRLSVVASFFPTGFSRLDHLSPWLRALTSDQSDGRLAYLFDNDEDTLNLETQMAGFDMTHLLDNESSEVIFSVMLYLFHRIETLIAPGNRLIGIYLDEGWQLLDNHYWVSKMKSYLATLRKQNAFIVFTTQSPNTVATSPLRNALIEGTATNIFLPNPKADAVDYMDGFKLSKREFDFIKTTHPRERRFLIKQGHEVAIGKLNLAGLDDYVAVLSGNKSTVELFDEIHKEVGDNPTDWLPIFQKRRPR